MNRYNELYEYKKSKAISLFPTGMGKKEKEYLDKLIEKITVHNINKEEADKIIKVLPKIKFPSGENWFNISSIKANVWSESGSYEISLKNEHGEMLYLVMHKDIYKKLDEENRLTLIDKIKGTEYLFIKVE